ncbi:hypothetical protein FRC02_010913 [Tulasnella sp. 418]|nr:hypothetical protein FRC02_010913 [Tulasnella sp. 418]
MSFFIGPITGGLVAGAVYYSFSYSIETRTKDLQARFQNLNHQLNQPAVHGDPPAVNRVVYSPFREMLKRRWNEEVAAGFSAVQNFEVPWQRIQSTWEQVREKAKSVGQQ